MTCFCVSVWYVGMGGSVFDDEMQNLIVVLLAECVLPIFIVVNLTHHLVP